MVKNLNITILFIGLAAFGLFNSLFSQSDSSILYNNSLFELAQISVSSEKKMKQKLTNSTVTIQVVTSEQIARNAYFSLEDVLVELPGFQFRNILGLNSYTFLRGLPRQNNAILLLVDGIQVNELNSGGFYGGAQYNLSNAERIEIVYGPSSVIYGTNAISGIINIITKEPKSGRIISAQTGFGSFNTWLSNLTYSQAGEKLLLQVSGMIKSSAKANLSKANNDNLWDDNLEIFEDDYAIDLKAKYKKTTFGVNYMNRQSSTTTHNPSQNTVHKGYGTLWNLQLVNSYVKRDINFSDRLIVKNTFFHRNATIIGNSVKEVTDTGQTAYYRPNNQVGIESVIDFAIKDQFELIAGVFGHYEVLAEGYAKSYSSEFFEVPLHPQKPNMSSNKMAGVFVQPDFRFLTHWQVSPGVRLEYNTSYGQVLIPRASLLYNKSRYAAKLIYAKAFRAPKPWDFTSGTGNTGLKPEYFSSLELSNIYFISENLKTQVSVFDNVLQNGINKVFSATNSDFYWGNTGNVQTQGVEVSANYVRNKVSVKSSYSYTNTSIENNGPINEIAPHTAVLGFDYSFAKYFNIGLRTFYFGKRKNPKIIQATNSNYINPAVVVNLNLSVLNYKSSNIQLIVKNLTNTEYYHTSNLVPDRFRQPQFSIFLKLSYKIKKL